MGFALRISGLCALLAVCAAAGGRRPTPPTISLDLAGMAGGYHDFKLPVGKHPKIFSGIGKIKVDPIHIYLNAEKKKPTVQKQRPVALHFT